MLRPSLVRLGYRWKHGRKATWKESVAEARQRARHIIRQQKWKSGVRRRIFWGQSNELEWESEERALCSCARQAAGLGVEKDEVLHDEEPGDVGARAAVDRDAAVARVEDLLARAGVEAAVFLWG